MPEKIWKFKELLTGEEFEVSAKTKKGARGIVKRRFKNHYKDMIINEGIEVKVK
jgi:hypothetical protein